MSVQYLRTDTGCWYRQIKFLLICKNPPLYKYVPFCFYVVSINKVSLYDLSWNLQNEDSGRDLKRAAWGQWSVYRRWKWFTYNGSLVAVFIKMLIDVLRPGHVTRDKSIWVLALKRHSTTIINVVPVAKYRFLYSCHALSYVLDTQHHGPGEGWGDCSVHIADENMKQE